MLAVPKDKPIFEGGEKEFKLEYDEEIDDEIGEQSQEYSEEDFNQFKVNDVDDYTINSKKEEFKVNDVADYTLKSNMSLGKSYNFKNPSMKKLNDKHPLSDDEIKAYERMQGLKKEVQIRTGICSPVIGSFLI